MSKSLDSATSAAWKLFSVHPLGKQLIQRRGELLALSSRQSNGSWVVEIHLHTERSPEMRDLSCDVPGEPPPRTVAICRQNAATREYDLTITTELEAALLSLER